VNYHDITSEPNLSLNIQTDLILIASAVSIPQERPTGIRVKNFLLPDWLKKLATDF
jgi:hypothetical protein